jgi:2-oxoglutarate ferredoxin oxidoreductase subunit delta
VNVLTRGTVVIDTERCKGCELCIPACRPGVLTMSEVVNGQGARYPLLFAGCTACRACREVCPDFVFEVYRFDEPQMIDDGDGPEAAGAETDGPETDGPETDGPAPDGGAPGAGGPA